MGQLDFNRAPFIVIWEVTRACDLKCVHCRAEAQELRHPDELTTEQGFQLLDEVRRFGQPLFIFTGGDPLKRPDLFDLIAHAKRIGFNPGMSPSGTPLLTRENLHRAARAGISTVSISIDAPDAASHDQFRGVPGSFELSTEAARAVREEGMRLQINTTISSFNLSMIDRMAALVTELGAARWEVFYLVPTGRGNSLEQTSAEDFERVSHWLFDQTTKMDAHITAVEAGLYRRIVLQRLAAEEQSSPLAVFERSRSGNGRFLPQMNSGSGFVFVSHLGEIFPSGFLPISAGNVQRDSLVDVYRNHPIFTDLRNPELLKGRCGQCEFRTVCGGSRSRAFAVTGDYLESDPACVYQPTLD
jgi:radical SAM protein